MEQGESLTNLTRTRKQMCLTSMGDQVLTIEQKLNKFDEMVRCLGNQSSSSDMNRCRRTKSELCLLSGNARPHATNPFTDEDFFVTEIIADDAKQMIYINENNAKSEEFVM